MNISQRQIDNAEGYTDGLSGVLLSANHIGNFWYCQGWEQGHSDQTAGDYDHHAEDDEKFLPREYNDKPEWIARGDAPMGAG